MDPRDPDEAPEATNREQDDDGQAQDVAESALHPGPGLGESHKAPTSDAQILPDDVPDLVDTMNQMVSSGRIDNGAYAGEPMHDDEEGELGDTDPDEGDPLEGLHELPGGDGALTSSYALMPGAGGGEEASGLDPEDPVFNQLADGSEDPLAVPVQLDQVVDTGNDPLASVASSWGLEGGEDGEVPEGDQIEDDDELDDDDDDSDDEEEDDDLEDDDLDNDDLVDGLGDGDER